MGFKQWVRRLVHQARDRREEWYRHHPQPHAGNPRYNLSAMQMYPAGANLRASWAGTARVTLRGATLNRNTPVASIGSCFAEEISRLLREENYSYLICEPNIYAFSASWGRVWTIPNLTQIVDYSLDEDYPLLLAEGEHGFFDPLRETEEFEPDRAKAEQAVRDHRWASRQALSEAKVLFMTLGQNEAWRELCSGLVWARLPPKSLSAAESYEFKAETFTFEENCRVLERAISRLLEFNPELSIVLTVSPVAAWATFYDDAVVTRSFGNKCLLRAVAARMTETFARRVGYFPSFEIVLAENRDTFKADNRHVKYETVNRILATLSKATSKDTP